MMGAEKLELKRIISMTKQKYSTEGMKIEQDECG
jgi:hypothetical protein